MYIKNNPKRIELIKFIERTCNEDIFNYLQNINRIGEDSFRNCINLTNVLIPKGVSTIGKNAFYGCANLTTVTMQSVYPPTLVSSNAFPSNLNIIYIPKGSLSNYQSAAQWSNLSSKFVELQ